MLPIDLGVGGGIMLLLVLPNVLFYFGLCCKRWKRAPRPGTCPFLGGPAPNVCRVCGTHVSDRAFHRTCSVTTEQTHGSVVTVTTTTSHGWDHCAGCQVLKGHAPIIALLLVMLFLWARTVVERALAVQGITFRDERIRLFNITLYALTVVLGLVGWAVVGCTRHLLLKFTCLLPCCACVASASSSTSNIKSSRGARACASSGGTSAIVAPASAVADVRRGVAHEAGHGVQLAPPHLVPTPQLAVATPQLAGTTSQSTAPTAATATPAAGVAPLAPPPYWYSSGM